MKKQDLQKLIREEIKAVLAEEESTLNDYMSLLNKHDFYFRMSDDSRVYDRGMAEAQKLKSIYSTLTPEDKEKAFDALSAKAKPYFSKLEFKFNDFDGYI